MKASEILRKAAKHIQVNMRKSLVNRRGICAAIQHVLYAEKERILKQYLPRYMPILACRLKIANLNKQCKIADRKIASLYKPRRDAPLYWFNAYGVGWFKNCDGFSKKNQEHRIIATLLAADILESEGN